MRSVGCAQRSAHLSFPESQQDHAQKKTLTPVEQDRPDVAASRAAWLETQPALDPSRLIFIDETWAKTNMTRRRYGRARRRRRVCAKIPYGRWRTTTFIAGLRHDGIIAPFVIDGPIDGTSFLDYVVKVLVLELRPGDVVILDNLSSHKGEAIKAAIEAAGATLMFLPPYSPDLNPIELMFSKLKTLLRKAAERTVDALWNRIGELLDYFTPKECANFLRHAGYNQT